MNVVIQFSPGNPMLPQESGRPPNIRSSMRCILCS